MSPSKQDHTQNKKAKYLLSVSFDSADAPDNVIINEEQRKLVTWLYDHCIFDDLDAWSCTEYTEKTIENLAE